MPRQPKDGTKRQNFILHNVPADIWEKAKARASDEGWPLRALIYKVLEIYGAGGVIEGLGTPPEPLCRVVLKRAGGNQQIEIRDMASVLGDALRCEAFIYPALMNLYEGHPPEILTDLLSTGAMCARALEHWPEVRAKYFTPPTADPDNPQCL